DPPAWVRGRAARRSNMNTPKYRFSNFVVILALSVVTLMAVRLVSSGTNAETNAQTAGASTAKRVLLRDDLPLRSIGSGAEAVNRTIQSRSKAANALTGSLSPFATIISSKDISISPEFIATGDFDADGHFDVMAASYGAHEIYWMKGDGHGGFGEVKRIE